MLVMVVS